METINDADDEVKGKSEVNEEEKKEEVEEKEPTPDAKTKKSSLKVLVRLVAILIIFANFDR